MTGKIETGYATRLIEICSPHGCQPGGSYTHLILATVHKPHTFCMQLQALFILSHSLEAKPDV